MTTTIDATEFVVRDHDHLDELFTKYPEAERDSDLMARPNAIPLYFGIRENGEDHRFAAMCACRMAPRAETDREYYEGRHTLDQQFSDNPRQIREMEDFHQRIGFKPNRNSTYEPGLARFPFDPRAFITGGRTEIKRRCEQAGVACEGSVKVKGRQPENPTPAGKLAPDLVAQMIQQKVAANPDLARVPLRDLAADVQSQHGFSDANLVTRPTGLSPSANALLGKALAKKAAQKQRKK